MKAKTHKGLKARIKVTKNGKLMHARAGRRHLKSSKNGKRIRQARGRAALSPGDCRVVKRQYGLL